MHFERVNAVRQPAIRSGFQVLRRGIPNAFQRFFVSVRLSAENLALRQPVRLSPESSDALDPANKSRRVFCFHPLQLFGRGSLSKKARQFFIQLLFHLREILSRPRRRLHAELPADFAQSHECISRLSQFGRRRRAACRTSTSSLCSAHRLPGPDNRLRHSRIPECSRSCRLLPAARDPAPFAGASQSSSRSMLPGAPPVARRGCPRNIFPLSLSRFSRQCLRPERG